MSQAEEEMGGAGGRVRLQELAELRDGFGVAPGGVERDAEVHAPHGVGGVELDELTVGGLGLVEALGAEGLGTLLREQGGVGGLEEKQEKRDHGWATKV